MYQAQVPVQPATSSTADLLQLALSNPILAQLLLQQHIQPQYPNPATLLSQQNIPLATTQAAPPPPVTAPASPTVTLQLPRPISLQDFCEHFSISPEDERKLCFVI